MNFNKDRCKVPHLRRKKPLATGQAGDWLAGKQLCGRELGGLGRQRGEHGPALCLSSKAQQRPGLREQEQRQQTEQRGYHSHSQS